MADEPRPPIGPEALEVLRRIALLGEVARRLETESARAVLRSVVEATVALFEAEAASIALYDPATDRLVFEVAAGEQGQGVIGVAIRPDQGIAGYVFRSGQALALSDVASDPRFGRAVAEQTAYLPRSIVAVPLVDDHGTIGVLEVLDKRSQATFSLRDIELAAVFARQAAVAISASRVERDLASLLRATLRDLAASSGGASDDAIEELVRDATARIGGDDDSRLWALVEKIARIRRIDPDRLELVADLLDALARQAERDARTRRRGRSGGGTGMRAGRGSPGDSDARDTDR
ncbi:MAG: GAF domain-containing protein [Chloroflexota bacterium]|nr:GAF domain-containing protein [Chloroflexota bacterium]